MPNFFPCRYFPSFIPKSVNNGIPHTALDTHFNPRTRERCNPGTSTLTAASAHFNPYTPRMVRRKRGNTLMIPTLFQSTPPRGVRRVDRALFCRFRVISIHAPHAGCDSMVKIFRFYRRFQRHFREAENLPCTYRGFSQFFLLLASPSRYRIIVSLGS